MTETYIKLTNLVPNQISVRMEGDPDTERFRQYAANDDQLTIQFDALSDGKPHAYVITVTESSGRSESYTAHITVGTACRPVTTALLTGEKTPQPDRLLAYTVASDGTPEFTYEWTCYGGSIEGRANAPTVSVRWFQPGNASLTVKIKNPCGEIETRFPIVVLNATPCRLPIKQIDRIDTPPGQAGSTYRITLGTGANPGPYRCYILSSTGVTIQSGSARAETDGTVLFSLGIPIPAGSYSVYLETITDPPCKSSEVVFTHVLDDFPCNQACQGATYTPTQIQNWPLMTAVLRKKGNLPAEPFRSEASLINWLQQPSFRSVVMSGYQLVEEQVPVSTPIPVQNSSVLYIKNGVYPPIACGYIATSLQEENGVIRQLVILTLNNCGKVLHAETRILSTTDPVNHPPVGAPIDNKTLTRGVAFSYTAPESTDSDGHSLSYQWDGLPPGISGAGRVASGTPTQVGIYPVALTTTDELGLTDTKTATFTVVTPPVVPCMMEEDQQVGVRLVNGQSIAIRTKEFSSGWVLVLQSAADLALGRYYPVGNNVRTRSDVTMSKTIADNCLAGGTTGLGGLAKPTGLEPPFGFVSGTDSLGAVYFEPAPVQPTLPAAPSLLSALALSSSVISISWFDSATNETGYELERSLSAVSGFTLLAPLPANTTNYTDTGLTAGTQYCYRVRAKNNVGVSAYGGVFCVTTLGDTPTNPDPGGHQPYNEIWSGGENRNDYESTPFTLQQAPILDGTQNTDI
ncbi:hypothetical protein GCM10028806_34250 [Spirosoma terrae]|uniref:Fibronectin type III domain-containing protein n=1 Tax=Spirosoma terrae TaxID=1968276 RepID=A0A6L9LBA4_9BACT|nr:PKD domain-containing protein [Spirosoma terrae]NDU95738.1 hypothetical protein [Spirosoma terrae]